MVLRRKNLRWNALFSSSILPPHLCLWPVYDPFEVAQTNNAKFCTWISAGNNFVGFVQTLHLFEISYNWLSIEVIFKSTTVCMTEVT